MKVLVIQTQNNKLKNVDDRLLTTLFLALVYVTCCLFASNLRMRNFLYQIYFIMKVEEIEGS